MSNQAKKELEIRFRGSRLDAKRLDALARKYELTGSAVLRRLISEAHAANFPPKGAASVKP